MEALATHLPICCCLQAVSTCRMVVTPTRLVHVRPHNRNEFTGALQRCRARQLHGLQLHGCALTFTKPMILKPPMLSMNGTSVSAECCKGATQSPLRFPEAFLEHIDYAAPSALSDPNIALLPTKHGGGSGGRGHLQGADGSEAEVGEGAKLAQLAVGDEVQAAPHHRVLLVDAQPARPAAPPARPQLPHTAPALPVLRYGSSLRTRTKTAAAAMSM